jgi:hypothetical protein
LFFLQSAFLHRYVQFYFQTPPVWHFRSVLLLKTLTCSYFLYNTFY